MITDPSIKDMTDHASRLLESTFIRPTDLVSKYVDLQEALLEIASRRHGLSAPVVACLALGGHVGGRECNDPQQVPCLHCERCGMSLADMVMPDDR